MNQQYCQCGQTFLPSFEGDNDCHVCKRRKFAEFEASINSPYNAMKVVLQGYACTEVPIYFPLVQWKDHELYEEEFTTSDLARVVEELLLHEEWGFSSAKTESVKLVDIREELGEEFPNYTFLSHTECEETGLMIYEELAFTAEIVDKVFNDPEPRHFADYFFYLCFKGDIYSKDFSYSDCDACGRTVCQQNPSNGWQSQIHFMEDGSVVCNKCYEEHTLENGINVEFNGETVPGQYYNENEVLAAGWTKVEDSILVGHGRFGDYVDPKFVLNKIQRIIDEGLLCLVNYESLSIGGFGGYVSIYTKSPHQNEQKI